MKFSILVPTRNRKKPLMRLLSSIYLTTNCLDEIEVLLGIDQDDYISQDIYFEDSQFVIKKYCRNRTYSLSEYYNWLYEKSSGKYIWILNDDAVITTSCWDEKVLDHINKKNWKIFLGDTVDNRRELGVNMAFPSFPILSKEGIDALGWVLPPYVPRWGADAILAQIYAKNGRVIEMHDIFIHHKKINEQDGSKERVVGIDEDCQRLRKEIVNEKTNALV